MRRILSLLTLLALAACGSSPKTNYFALSPTQTGAARATLAFPVQIVAVHVPPSLDRQEMVRRMKGQAVELSDTDRWSAPLGEMVRNVLSEDLKAHLANGDLILPTAPAPHGTASIEVSIATFSADSTGRVALRGSWSLMRGGTDTPLLRRDIDLHAAGGSTAEQIASGMSNTLANLAKDIAATLASQHR